MSFANEDREQSQSTPNSRRIGTRRWLLFGGGLICLACWVALGIGFFMEASRGTLLVLATVTALATEGLFWLAAAIFGVTVFQARRKIWDWLWTR